MPESLFMDETTAIPADDVPDLQRTVQRKLGRCLLRLQQYERLMKAMVAHGELSGPANQLHAIREQKIASAQKKTMGTLVGMFTESHMTLPAPDEETSQPEIDPGDQNWFSYRYQIEMPAEHFEATKAALKELVDLRNELVHHFIERFDLWSAPGCSAADGFLEESYETIDRHYLELHRRAKSMEDARATMVSFMQSQAFEDILNGIWADGSIDWHGSGVCRCLREAETALAEGGWTRLETAIRWIGDNYPKHTPKRYGCSSWRHVLHESRQFEIRKAQADEQRTAVWYRSKAR